MSIDITVLVRGSSGLEEVAQAVQKLLSVSLTPVSSDDDPYCDCRTGVLDTWITVFRADLVDDQGLPLSRYEVAIGLDWTRTTLHAEESLALRRLMAVFLARSLVAAYQWDCLVLEGVQHSIPF